MDANVQAACRSLMKSMGFPESQNLGPYIAYIRTQAPSGVRLIPWLRLFGVVVDHFQTNEADIDTFLDELSTPGAHSYFDDILCLKVVYTKLRRDQVMDTVFRMIGIWVLMGSYFGLSGPFKHILMAKAAGGNTVSRLVRMSCLLPHPEPNNNSIAGCDPTLMNESAVQVHASLTAMESLAVDSKHLNAFRLSALARIRIHWTTNISRHMMLSQYGCRYRLELFALPCTLAGRSHGALDMIGIPSSLVYEIRNSYAALLNPIEPSSFHKLVLRRLGAKWWCWCLFCSSRRLLGREIKALKASSKVTGVCHDSALEMYADKRAPRWSQTLFRNLWPRIMALDAHLQQARPWGFWVLFRDRRDTLQFWTFLFGTLILVFTCMQVALGVAQVVGAF